MTFIENHHSEWESIIANYRGSRPLKNWWEYIQWIQRAYAKSDPEHKFLQDTIERCFKSFGTRDEYRNDDTYIRIWLTYVSFSLFSFYYFHHVFVLFIHSCLFVFRLK